MLPWKVRHASRVAQNALAYFKNRMHGAFTAKQGEKTIVFCCKFHGTTGATIAIARIANLFADKYAVCFIASPASDYNPMLGSKVRIASWGMLQKRTFDLYVCDGHMDVAFFSRMAAEGRRSLLTIHGVLGKENKLEKVFLATKSHLVSEIQFMHHEVDPSRYFVIPNYCEKVAKTRHVGNVGVVGRVADPNKNVPEALSIAEASDARMVHVWGGSDSGSAGGRVRYHAWTRRKKKIYDSFDVLVSMSRQESMGLTVIEAMSCGIPCVLSDIPGFRIYKDCPGIALVPLGDKDAAVREVNRFLNADPELGRQMETYWKAHYSRDAVAQKWFKEVRALVS
ncbi:glycosyltransferase [Thiobacillus denitrificans]|uniref:glycosyltransferase n=1 Tax=Thiobacillus denitrificans TaxID=36861 RepID=UPI00037DA95E|nr:glycosyltransferase [Thiobacillus denitrificans]